MTFKRIASWLLTLALLLSLAACTRKAPPSGQLTPLPTQAGATEPAATQETTPQESSITPLLYKVTDKEGHTAWLFGSIHVGREDFYPLPAYVMNAFTEADALAVEADIIAFEADMSQQIDAIMCLVYTDGSSIADHLSPELYTRAVAAMTELGSYMSLLDMYCPALWSSLIDSLLMEKMEGIDINLGIDRFLLEQAKTAQKPILEIESAKEQYEMLAGFSPELQALMLEGSLEGYDDQEASQISINLLLKLWSTGNEELLGAYLNEEPEEPLTPEEEALYAQYNKAMITDRNIAMADYAENALASGQEVFICVGAAHVVGEGAMADLLTQRGYTVEVVK